MSTEIANPKLSAHDDTLLQRGLLATVVLACGLALSSNHADPDLWGHVQYGRDMLRDGLPQTCTYSYSAAGHAWINHEILSELALAWGFDTLGGSAMLVGKCLLGLAIIIAILLHARRLKLDAATCAVVVMLIAANIMLFWRLRPQIASYVLFTLLLLLVRWCFAGWRTFVPALFGRARNGANGVDAASEATNSRGAVDLTRLRWLWLAAPLFFVWANSHGGFVAGLCVFAAYCLGRSLEAAVALRRRALPVIARLLAVSAACALATLANPYGLRLHAWLAMSLGTDRPEIVEWLPPDFNLYWLQFWLLVAVTLAALAATSRPRDVIELAILGLVLWQATEHRRHIVFFAILFGFWMPQHVGSLFERLRGIFRPGGVRRSASVAGMSPRVQRAIVAMLFGLCAFIGYALSRQCAQVVVRRDAYPAAAFQYMVDQQLNGKLVVNFRWAQYAIAAFGAADDPAHTMQVFFDGRFRTCYPQRIVDMYFDFGLDPQGGVGRARSPHSPPLDRSRALRYRKPDLVLIGRTMKSSIEVMQQHADAWVLLYQDEIAQLWGSAEKYDNPFSPHYLPLERRRITDEQQSGIVAWPALPARGDEGRQTEWTLANTSSTKDRRHGEALD